MPEEVEEDDGEETPLLLAGEETKWLDLENFDFVSFYVTGDHPGRTSPDSYTYVLDASTGDVFMPVSQLRQLAGHKNYSRNVQTPKYRVVADTSMMWECVREAGKELKIALRALDDRFLNCGHICLILLPIVYNYLAEKHPASNLFARIRRDVHKTSYSSLVTRPSGDDDDHRQEEEEDEEPALCGKGPRDVDATLARYAIQPATNVGTASLARKRTVRHISGISVAEFEAMKFVFESRLSALEKKVWELSGGGEAQQQYEVSPPPAKKLAALLEACEADGEARAL